MLAVGAPSTSYYPSDTIGRVRVFELTQLAGGATVSCDSSDGEDGDGQTVVELAVEILIIAVACLAAVVALGCCAIKLKRDRDQDDRQSIYRRITFRHSRSNNNSNVSNATSTTKSSRATSPRSGSAKGKQASSVGAQVAVVGDDDEDEEFGESSMSILSRSSSNGSVANMHGVQSNYGGVVIIAPVDKVTSNATKQTTGRGGISAQTQNSNSSRASSYGSNTSSARHAILPIQEMGEDEVLAIEEMNQDEENHVSTIHNVATSSSRSSSSNNDNDDGNNTTTTNSYNSNNTNNNITSAMEIEELE